MNDRTHRVVALEMEVATTRADRRRGLLGRDSLGASEGLMLSPCAAVHTAFMRFPIDVVFVDADGRAVRVVPQVKPWRMTASFKARSVIELPAGTAAVADIKVGDLLYLAPPPRQKREELERARAC
jgi:uncharacterized membrane protein (UPF0127 family)